MPLQSPRFLQNARIKSASENKPPLKQGDVGEAVVILQLALIDLGNSMPKSTRNGKRMPDGIFGSETFQLVSDFQRTNGLAVDGVVGRDTLAELERQIVELIKRKAADEAAQVQRAKIS
jgi:peptidoglycan hydrolase-like protein with peptidoglycan-binding domain